MPEEGLVSEGHSLLSAGVPSMMGTHDTQASSYRSMATLRALLASPPQESSDVSATPDVAEVTDPEAETYANVGASINLRNLEVEAATNVGASFSPHALDVEVSTNVGNSTSLDL